MTSCTQIFILVVSIFFISWSCGRDEFLTSTTFDAREWELSTAKLSLNEIEALMAGEWTLRYTTLQTKDKSLIRNFGTGEIIWLIDSAAQVVYRDSDTKNVPYSIDFEHADPQNQSSPLVPVVFIDREKSFLSIQQDKMIISYAYMGLPNYYFERYD